MGTFGEKKNKYILSIMFLLRELPSSLKIYSIKGPLYWYCSWQGSPYHEDPWGSHGPRHTQQKSALQFWFLHTMWLHPPSFSIVTWHLGHSYKVKFAIISWISFQKWSSIHHVYVLNFSLQSLEFFYWPFQWIRKITIFWYICNLWITNIPRFIKKILKKKKE